MADQLEDLTAWSGGWSLRSGIVSSVHEPTHTRPLRSIDDAQRALFRTDNLLTKATTTSELCQVLLSCTHSIPLLIYFTEIYCSDCFSKILKWCIVQKPPYGGHRRWKTPRREVVNRLCRPVMFTRGHLDRMYKRWAFLAYCVTNSIIVLLSL